jgi:hypothetical protein
MSTFHRITDRSQNHSFTIVSLFILTLPDPKPSLSFQFKTQEIAVWELAHFIAKSLQLIHRGQQSDRFAKIVFYWWPERLCDLATVAVILFHKME